MNLEIHSKFPAVLMEDIFYSLKYTEDLVNFLVDNKINMLKAGKFTFVLYCDIAILIHQN